MHIQFDFLWREDIHPATPIYTRTQAIDRRQMASAGFVEEMMREQSLLEATCGDLFDYIDDLLDFPKEESAADVLLLDAPAPGSPLSARIIDVGGRGGNAPALEPLPPPAAQDDAAAFFAAAGAPVFDAKDVGGHIGPVRPHYLPPCLRRRPRSGSVWHSRVRPGRVFTTMSLRPAAGRWPAPVTTARIALAGRAPPSFNFFSY